MATISLTTARGYASVPFLQSNFPLQGPGLLPCGRSPSAAVGDATWVISLVGGLPIAHNQLEIAEIVAVREYADFFAEDVRQRWGALGGRWGAAGGPLWGREPKPLAVGTSGRGCSLFTLLPRRCLLRNPYPPYPRSCIASVLLGQNYLIHASPRIQRNPRSIGVG
jgi:hypothetical protein